MKDLLNYNDDNKMKFIFNYFKNKENKFDIVKFNNNNILCKDDNEICQTDNNDFSEDFEEISEEFSVEEK